MTGRSSGAIVIGAGHNGLVAACYLAQAGHRVTVVEASPRIGGMSTSEALITGAPHHLVNPCAVDMILLRASPIVTDLGLARYGFQMVEVDPPFVHPAPDGATLAIWRDAGRTGDEIRRFSAADAAAYLELAETMHAALDIGLPYLLSHPTRPPFAALRAMARGAGRHARVAGRILGLLRSSTADAIAERFQHPVTRAPMAVLCGLGPLTAPRSGAYLMVYGLVHRLGVGRVVGGTQSLPDALAACLRDAGGAVRTSTPVEQILVGGGRVRGVRLAGGEEVTADVVVSACDPVTTLDRLVPRSALGERVARRVDAIPTGNDNLASFKVDLALSGRLQLRRHQADRSDGLDLRRPTALIGTYDDVVDAHAHASRGELPVTQPMYGVIPSAADPSQAPPGQDTLYLWQGWVPGAPAERWDHDTDVVGKAVVAEAATYYDGLEELEIGRALEAWPALTERAHATAGNLFHVDVRPSTMGPFRPALGLAGYRTPVEGLVLSGNGTHPGSGVSGLSGVHAARVALRELAR